MMVDVQSCTARLGDWNISCWRLPDHPGAHQGGNYGTRRRAVWGSGAPTHVAWMPDWEQP